MLRAYPAEPTVDAGGTLKLHISTDEPRFHVRLERWAGGCRPILAAGPFRGTNAPPGSSSQPWDWPAIELKLPQDLDPGAYVVRSRTNPRAAPPKGPRDGSPDARWGTALIVVRAPSAARVVVNLPLFTYHAYNMAALDGTQSAEQGHCLYSGSPAVTLMRPGGGTGGHPWDEVHPDVYDRTSPRQTFAHWDLHALDWFAREGIAVDLCTDLDLQRGTIPLDRYAMLCSFGHDEYWSREKRAAIERFVEDGGAVGFFGGNTCWFRIRYDEATRSIARDGQWSNDRPEDTITGLSFRRGGGKWIGTRPPTGFRIVHERHPIMRDAGVRAGQIVGAASSVIGYECDGIDPRFAPPNLTVLARAPLDAWDVGDGSGVLSPGGHAAIVAFARGEGMVFNAGTTDWARALAQGDRSISAITRSVVRLFTGRRGPARR